MQAEAPPDLLIAPSGGKTQNETDADGAYGSVRQTAEDGVNPHSSRPRWRRRSMQAEASPDLVIAPSGGKTQNETDADGAYGSVRQTAEDGVNPHTSRLRWRRRSMQAEASPDLLIAPSGGKTENETDADGAYGSVRQTAEDGVNPHSSRPRWRRRSMPAEASPDLVIAPSGGKTQNETDADGAFGSNRLRMHWYGVHQPRRWVLEKGGKQEIMIRYMDKQC